MINRFENYFQRRYSQFSTRTNMHGFSELYLSKSYGKMFWIFTLAVCLSITAFQLTRAVVHYIKEPYITVIEKLKDKDILYPYLSICYDHWLGWVDVKNALDLNFTKESFIYGVTYFTDIYVEDYFDIELAKQQFLHSMAQNKFSRISDFFFAIAKKEPSEGFTEKRFVFIDNVHYFCYQANNSVIARMIRRRDRKKDEKVILRFEIDEKSNDNLNEDFLTINERDCYVAKYLADRYFLFANSDKMFMSKTRENEIHIPFYIDVGANLVELRRDDSLVSIKSHSSVSTWQNLSHRPCRENDVSISSEHVCKYICIDKYKSESCSCSRFEDVVHSSEDYLNRLRRKEVHFFTTLNACIKLAVNKSKSEQIAFYNSNSQLKNDSCCEYNETKLNQLSECEKRCIPGCTIWNYYLGSVERANLEWFKSAALIKSSIVVDVLFSTSEEIIYTNEIENQNFEKFVGNIGGLLGIWTGASILSIVQLIYLCCCGEFSCCVKQTTKHRTACKRTSNDAECAECMLDT